MRGWQGMGRIVCVVGARPNYMKMGPLMRAFAARRDLPPVYLVHTGQHYDVAMNERLFADLELAAPDVNLEVGSGSHAVQTAEVMRRFEPVLDEETAAAVVVVGDVNSTLAVTLVAAKKGVPVVHVEAGLRSFDREMPEEINRLVTDQLSSRLYTSERSGDANLLREGIAPERIVFAGNVMIDSVVQNRQRAQRPEGFAGPFGVVTLHRPSNVDAKPALGEALHVLRDIAARIPLVWPVHPRARANIDRFGFAPLLASSRITLLPPQGYLEMLGFLSHAAVVLTDSGGIQEETTALAVPCLTMRENTERPITVEEGTNTLIGRDRAAAIACVDAILAGNGKAGRVPELWDGHAAERIAADLAQWLRTRELARDAA